MGCLKIASAQKQLVRVQIILKQTSCQCQWLLLEYMQTPCYLSQTCTRVSVNEAGQLAWLNRTENSDVPVCYFCLYLCSSEHFCVQNYQRMELFTHYSMFQLPSQL